MSDENETAETQQHRSIPAFEGHPVNATAIKVTGSLVFDCFEDEVVGVDDIVQVISQFRCVGVGHTVDEKTGLITRVQVLRPIEMVPFPIDPNDPNDTGIVRALPRPVTGHVVKKEGE